MSDHVPSSDEAWADVLDTVTKYDNEMLANWKDDLNSLLIFAGLFSSVVTGFVVQSFGSLQPDTSPGVSVLLLAQISTQLASLSISDGFINSTAPSLSIDQLSPPSAPPPSSVRINILWFLSLGLSLTASLLAIIVQQWLREYRYPVHLSVRERVRLRHLRYQALEDWSVPGIVSILPVLLQAALSLFLTGLCYLLFTLDKLTAIAFVAFVGVAMSAYFAFLVLPVFFRHCPYRNPLSHTILSTVRSMKLALNVAYRVTVCLVLRGIYRVTVWVDEHTKFVSRSLCGTLFDKRNDVTQNLGLALTAMQRSVGDHDLWRQYDIGSLYSVFTERLDHDALTWTLSILPKAKLSTFTCCLEDLPDAKRLECVMAWVAGTLHVDIEDLDIGPYGKVRSSNCILGASVVTSRLDATFIARFKDTLLEVLPGTSNEKSPRFAYTVLVLLYKLARNGATSDIGFRGVFARRLVAIVAAQVSQEWTSLLDRWTIIPSICLLDLAQKQDYIYTENDLNVFVDHALRMLVIEPRIPRYKPPEVSMVTLALPFHVMALQPTLLSALLNERLDLRRKYCKMLELLHDYLRRDPKWIRSVRTFEPNIWKDGVALEVASTTAALCRSLATLAEADALPLPPNSDNAEELTVNSLFDRLIHVLDYYEVQGAYEDAVNCLRQARAQLLTVPVDNTTSQQLLPRAMDTADIARCSHEDQVQNDTATHLMMRHVSCHLPAA